MDSEEDLLHRQIRRESADLLPQHDLDSQLDDEDPSSRSSIPYQPPPPQQQQHRPCYAKTHNSVQLNQGKVGVGGGGQQLHQRRGTNGARR